LFLVVSVSSELLAFMTNGIGFYRAFFVAQRADGLIFSHLFVELPALPLSQYRSPWTGHLFGVY